MAVLKNLFSWVTTLSLCTFLIGCSNNNQVKETTTSQDPGPLRIDVTSQQNIEHWNVSLRPRTLRITHDNSVGSKLVYDIQVEYTGDSPVSLTLSYRIDTKDNISGSITPNQTIQLSEISPHEKVSINDLSLPMNTPIGVGLTWVENNTNVLTGQETFKITPIP